jgi:hypothetical protein
MFYHYEIQHLNCHQTFADVIEDQFYQRWKMLMTNVHYARAFLNPYLLGEAHLYDDANAKEALNKVL